MPIVGAVLKAQFAPGPILMLRPSWMLSTRKDEGGRGWEGDWIAQGYWVAGVSNHNVSVEAQVAAGQQPVPVLQPCLIFQNRDPLPF